MPGFKVSKDRLTLSLGASDGGGFQLKPMTIYHSESWGPLRITLNLLSLCSIIGMITSGWQHISLQHGLPNSLISLLKPTAQNKKFLSKYCYSLTMHLVTWESSDEDLQWDECCFHGCLWKIHSVVLGLSNSFDSQILWFQKYTS